MGKAGIFSDQERDTIRTVAGKKNGRGFLRNLAKLYRYSPGSPEFFEVYDSAIAADFDYFDRHGWGDLAVKVSIIIRDQMGSGANRVTVERELSSIIHGGKKERDAVNQL